jgi:ATP-binding cassette, subfamily C (CFTR/MRP), member 1
LQHCQSSVLLGKSRAVPFIVTRLQAIGLLLSILLAFYYSKVLYLSIPYKPLFLASLFASILATLCLSLLLWHEQQRPPRAFDLVSLYLLISIICDAGYLALPSSNDGYPIASRPILFRCCLYLAFLVLEHWPAERFMFGIPNEVESHKQLHGFFSRTFFLWINPILLRGYNTILVSDDVPPLNPEMKPRDTREAMIRAWSQRGEIGP